MPRLLVFLVLSLPLVGAYAMYAVGITVIYQASRVLNLAHGAMATVPAYLVYTLVVRGGVPVGVAVLAGVAAGAALGVGVERLFVRRLRPAGPTAQTVGTAAAFALLVSLTARLWGTTGLRAPAVFPEGSLAVGASILRFGQIGLFGVAVVVAGGMHLLLHRTWAGLAMRAAAQSRRGASYVGIDPDRTATAAWALGGGLAAAAGVLLAAVTILHAYSLPQSALPAFVAALMGGLESLPGALAGSAVVGVVGGLVPVLGDLPGLRLVLGQVGGAELALAVTAMVVMALRGERFAAGELRAEAVPQPVAPPQPRPPRRPRWPLVVVVGWVFWPGVPFTLLGDANQALLYAIVAASLVLLTGWVGQISLAQAAFVGVGAFSSVLLGRRAGLPFPFSLPVACGLAAAVALLLGLVALRVRGLYLAVATLIFGWMADSYLFSQPWFAGAGGSATYVVEPIGLRGGYPYFDFSERRTFYLLALAGTALVLLGLSNLRRSKTGRALLAVRGSEVAAASLGIDVTRYKLVAFALSGAVAGLAGNLLATGQQTLVASQFAFTVSLLYLSVAVVGGLQSLGGAVAASLLFAGLNELFFRVEALRGWLEVVSAGLLASVLLFYPGGLAALPQALSRLRASGAPRGLAALGERLSRPLRRRPDLVLSWHAAFERRGLRSPGLARLWRALFPLFGVSPPPATLPTSPPPPSPLAGTRPPVPPPDLAVPRLRAAPPGPVLEAEGIRVRFGGLVAVDGVSLRVDRGEIVGLIGPNGAGKTTLFNALAGYLRPEAGRVRLGGEDVTSLPTHQRALRGLGRTFQAVQLFGPLTVIENLLVATHATNPTGLPSHLAATEAARRAEREAERRVEEVIALLGLEEVAGRPAAGLPFGTLRMVELARALVSGAPVLMADEPASGLDSRETEQLAATLASLRSRLGLSVLLIEHDVGLVMGLCDRVYVMDAGRLIASGPPAAVQRDPAVLAAYLGTAPTEAAS